MGRDKALLPFRGSTLAGSIAREVAAAAGSVTLVGNAGLGRAGLGAIPDLYPGEGPLGGILTALTHSAADWNLVVACDMPFAQAAFLRRLIDAASQSGADALLPRGPSGLPEPLCAVYHRRALPVIHGHFAGGTRKVTAALEGLAVVSLEVAEVALFQNLNTPEDWAAHAGE
jgi:molybdopterin-guanine dinucleotide biosynthesis protein A